MKKLFTLFFVGAFAFAVAACGGGSTEAEDESMDSMEEMDETPMMEEAPMDSMSMDSTGMM